MAILTNQKPTIYRNLYENTGPDLLILGDFQPQNSPYFIRAETFSMYIGHKVYVYYCRVDIRVF